MILAKIHRAICCPSLLWSKLLNSLYAMRLLSDKSFLSLKFRLRMGYFMDWKHPRTFSEKLQWLKLYDRRSEYTVMADKVTVKTWVAERIGSEYIIPTLGVWQVPKDVDFDMLPDQFVIKCNHNSGTGMYICKDKSQLDVERVRQGLQKGLRENYCRRAVEWPYRNIPRRIIAEQYLQDNDQKGDLFDYKFFCFNGIPRYCQVIRDRSTKETIDFYDMAWEHQDFVGLFSRSDENIRNGDVGVARPILLDEMQEICKQLSRGIPFVRIDLYLVNGRIYFGEMTFFPAGGIGVFTPDDWNYKFGDLLSLPR